MSRDQRPGRAVMVGNAPETRETATDTVVAAAVPDATPQVVKPSIVVPALLFLIACIAGAVGLTMLLRGSTQ